MVGEHDPGVQTAQSVGGVGFDPSPGSYGVIVVFWEVLETSRVVCFNRHLYYFIHRYDTAS